MIKLPFSLLLLLGLLNATVAEAGIKMTIPCQQSLSDGRILVDGTLLPSGARYKVLSYKPKTSDNGWSSGECVLDITKGASG